MIVETNMFIKHSEMNLHFKKAVIIIDNTFVLLLVFNFHQHILLSYLIKNKIL